MTKPAISANRSSELRADYLLARMRTVDLLEKYSCSWHSLYSALRRFEIPLRRTRCRVNEDFFDVLTPASAWVLGLWITDGSVESHKNSRRLRIGFSDKQLLFAVHTLLGAENVVSYSSRKNFWYFKVSSHSLYESLRAFGVREKKSLRTVFPDVSDDILPHLVRGIFDGDGCVYIRKNRNLPVAEIVSAARPFLEEMSSRIHSVLDLNSSIRAAPDSRCYRLNFSTQSSLTLAAWMYHDSAGLRCDAKFRRFSSYLSTC